MAGRRLLLAELFNRLCCQSLRGDANGFQQNGGGNQRYADDRYLVGFADHVHAAAQPQQGIAVGGTGARAGQ